MAPPPIQLPASVARPLQTASKPAPPTVSGEKVEIIKIAIGPPIIIPTYLQIHSYYSIAIL